MNIKKKAFTITEIVVAMLVLGAIAMILTPALYNSTEERVTDAALNKTYSNFQQTARSVGLLISSGKLTPSSSSPAFTFFQALTETSKTISALDMTGNSDVVSVRTGSAANKVKATMDEYLDGYNPDNDSRHPVTGIVPSYSNTIILKNGVFVMISGDYIVIDVNGKRKPNRVGNDIFYFTVNAEDNSYSIKPVMTGNCDDITSSDNTQAKRLNKRIGCARERLKIKL